MKSAALAAFALLLFLAPAPAAADEADAAFDRATALVAAGDDGAAAEALEALAARWPDSARADDALFLAARLAEDELGDPARALALYRRLVERYPDSRVALAAGRRAEALAGALGPGGAGDAALARFRAILGAYTVRGHDASVRAAEELLAESPDWAGRDQVHLWLGRVQARAGHLADAARHIEAAIALAADAGARDDARLVAGEVAALRGDHDAAAAHYRAIDTSDPARARTVQDALAQLERSRGRARLSTLSYGVALAALLLLLASLRAAAGSWRAAARALRRPPTEVIYFAPVGLLLFAFALTGHEMIAPAVAVVTGGGLALSWLSGAALRARPARRRAVAHALIAAAGMAALLYATLHHNGLLDLLLGTLRFGPEL